MGYVFLFFASGGWFSTKLLYFLAELLWRLLYVDSFEREVSFFNAIILCVFMFLQDGTVCIWLMVLREAPHFSGHFLWLSAATLVWIWSLALNTTILMIFNVFTKIVRLYLGFSFFAGCSWSLRLSYCIDLLDWRLVPKNSSWCSVTTEKTRLWLQC